MATLNDSDMTLLNLVRERTLLKTRTSGDFIMVKGYSVATLALIISLNIFGTYLAASSAKHALFKQASSAIIDAQNDTHSLQYNNGLILI